MASCLITFNGKYYKYKGEGDNNDRGLAICGYESAFLADLVASYLLIKFKTFFSNTKFHGIYQDDGFVVFSGLKNFNKLNSWLKNFQQLINKIVE